MNGRPTLVVRRAGKAVAVLAAPTDGARIGTLWIVLNPAKLRRWQDERVHLASDQTEKPS